MNTVIKERKTTTAPKRKATTRKKPIANKISPLEVKFESALDTLNQAKPFAKSLYQTDVYQLANELASTSEGMSVLFKYAHLFDQAGVFLDGDWEDPTKLQPPFVGGSLRLRGIYSILELLSEMRMLAIAKGTYQHESLSPEHASSFLNEVLALNLDLLFPEEQETELEEHLIRAQNLFTYLRQELSFESVAEQMVQEINRMTVQRPILTRRIIELIENSKLLINDEIDSKIVEELEKYSRATDTPTPLSEEAAGQREYRLKLEQASKEELISEAELFAESMYETGLVSPYHAILLRFLNRKYQEIIPSALLLSETGVTSFNENKELIHDIIQLSIYPETKQAIYGLSKMLNRGVLKLESLIPAIRQLFELPIHAEVKIALSNYVNGLNGISINGILVAGVVSVLGQPLGIGQGVNPICQSARAISLWAQYDIDKLFTLITSAIRDNNIEMAFEGELINSSLLLDGVATQNLQDLDPVSILLVPHLDKIYTEMMKRTLLRGEDGHKWVNREFYGEWIPSGFINVIDPLTLNVTNYSSFVKLFYATHHPDYNEGYKMLYPNPVGIFLTNVHGELLGLHAVSIQRIEKDQHGECRIYFYNPNNDGTQNWGQNIKASVSGFGELEGESSLPFHEFVSRMYAYHYNPYEQGDAYIVEETIVEKVETLARESWGKNYEWA
ncbi:hypothetical protein SAMN05880501_105116 [Ureibacillus xyleni]|uniref:Uncharacterized protein n=1 Tax=Ureibacillus xyleni TaxID=614648 RepID=A0A285SKT9_9BACL|nr:hypothetical protein [Ureibacillus xyleni]SOC08631.1 hypothetical protein SAMN05880501_105116 [Ureibacillus xyleni]